MNKLIENLRGFFIPKSEIEDDELICTIDGNPVDCMDFQEDYSALEAPTHEYDDIPQENRYTGVPAPAYLENDDWFGSSPIKSEKQLDYMEQEIEMKRQEREQNFSVEPDDIHQKMYEIATKNQNTTLQLNPMGGSENCHEGPGGWNSGNGWGVLKK